MTAAQSRHQYCFVDIDGVLADFVRGVFTRHDVDIPWDDIRWDFDKQLGLTPREFWGPLGEAFWAGLQPTPEFHGVIAAVTERFGVGNTFLLSSPCSTPGCAIGKARWVERYLPEFTRRLLLTNVKDAMAGPGRLLIDDHEKNCESWTAAGGVSFLFPRPWNYARHLEYTAVMKLTAFLESFPPEYYEKSQAS